jgi:eukaryotic-like serine/threonine-protein kinase
MFAARNDAMDLGPPTHADDSGMHRKGEREGERMGHARGDLVAWRYRLTSVIARGGMGTIWRARNETTGDDLAVKVPNVTDAACAAESTRHFLSEATAAASVRHSAIVRILHFGVAEDDRPFIAMELLNGQSLRETIRGTGGLQAVDAVRMLLPILDALRCAHARGIVHCDVKPENILLVGPNDAADAKLIDFGIARIDGAQSQPTDGDSVFGSLAYMSPEQVRGRSNIDSRSDLWSFMVVVYEAISGARPWNVENCLALQRAIVRAPAPSIVGVHGVDEALWCILKRGLDKDRKARWQSSADLIEALLGWLRARGQNLDASMAPSTSRPAKSLSSEPASLDATRDWNERLPAVPTLRSASLAGMDEDGSTVAESDVAPKRATKSPKSRGRNVFAFCAALALLVVARVAWVSAASLPAVQSRTRTLITYSQEPCASCASMQCSRLP